MNNFAKAAAIAAVISLPVNTLHAVEMSPEDQKGGVAVGSIVTGALAGGPIGAVIGIFAGQWLGDKVEEAHVTRETLTQVEQELESREVLLAELKNQLIEAERESARYAQAVFDQLQLELSFRTGQAELPKQSLQRLEFLAQFMINNPSIELRLDGYADPRGDEAYNQTLSSQRVDWVANQLIQRGVPEHRMQRYAHGEKQSVANSGDIDGYALERVVKIQLQETKEDASVVQK